MRRSPRVILAWFAALVVVLVTMRVVTNDLGALHRRAHTLGADVTVVLAARDLPLGHTIAANDVYSVRRPARTVSADALRDPARAIGHVVAVALLRDDVVGERHLDTGDRSVGLVPPGRRAVHVVIKDGFQPPVGAVVDVLATYDPSLTGLGDTNGAATVVARGAQVVALAAGPGGGAGTVATLTDDTTGSGVTLLVTEAEARSVAFAAAIGVVALALAPAASACCPAAATP